MSKRSLLLSLLLEAVLVAIAFAALGAGPAHAAGVDAGVIHLRLSDPARKDPFAAPHPRMWNVDLYYRAAHPAAPPRYAPDTALLDALIHGDYYGQAAPLLQSWRDKPGAAAENVRAEERPFPLITISPGLGMAALNYAEVAAELVHRGFAVAVIDHPYLGISRVADGRILDASVDPAMQSDDPAAWSPRIGDWVTDISFTLSAIAGAAELKRAGLHLEREGVTAAGHSSGGAVALDACAADRRISACADFEGTPEGTRIAATGPVKPVLATLSRSGKPDCPQTAPDLSAPSWAFLSKGKSKSAWAVNVRGGSHLSFSDAPNEMPDTLSRFGGELMTPARSMELYCGMLASFATAYRAGGGGDAAFRAVLAASPEVRMSQAK